MDLPKLQDLDVNGKKVLLRLDLDCNPDPNEKRIKSSEETLDYLKQKGAQIIIIAHKGRPAPEAMAGDAVPSDRENLSLVPFQKIFDRWGAMVHENLRFDPGEEANDMAYARGLAALADVYVNEAFASSHRAHASIVGLPAILPHAAGFRFQKEVENLSKVLVDPRRPLLFLISGLKEDKLNYVKAFEPMADRILIGGRLPEFMGDEALKSIKLRTDQEKVWLGNLNQDKEDITLNTIDVFEKEIAKARTIVVSGPLGKYEDLGHRQGTERVLTAVTKSIGFRVAGGGDTEDAISLLQLNGGFDWISVGGGAMLDFLANGTLPGIEALKNQT